MKSHPTHEQSARGQAMVVAELESRPGSTTGPLSTAPDFPERDLASALENLPSDLRAGPKLTPMMADQVI
ncbi:hypothetical protein NDU88_004679 [Pleurodeles waltl]|uniref:Uncharacterized protein n=1 Tax=Pleurodeles waltl TaxID=8319 RepID=A0AAV7T8A3_PLEWA|nr:hypothetical protein NDU88_004679 [Pleurodeles waltl]